MKKDYNITFIDCPWRSSKLSPRRRNIGQLADYILEQPKKPESMLEMGCGITTWYLSQLNFQDYVAVETYDPPIQEVRKHVPSVKVVEKWTDIPKIKYQYLLVDSHVGGDEVLKSHEREKTLIYVMENDLLSDDAILIAHDYHRIKAYRGDHTSKYGKQQRGWNDAVDKYGWKISHEIMYRKCFGIYKRD